MVDETVERHGRLDILVNNAGLYASLDDAPVHRDPARGVAAGDGRERRLDVPDLPRGGAGDARPGRRQDRQHLVGHAVPRRAVPAPLRDEQGRDRRAHARAGEGARQGRDPRQLRRARVHDERGREGAPGGGREAARRLGRLARTIQRDQVPEDVVGAVVFLCTPAPTSSPARRWSSTAGSPSIDPRALAARHGARNAVTQTLDDGTTLVWELLDEEPADALLAEPVEVEDGWLMRYDRVDFPPGGIAYRHTHPGPGIRYLLHGSLRIDSGGETHEYGPGEAWFESGPEPVLATASETEETAFVRVLLLPPRVGGKRTIRYVDPADEERPKLQRATVFLEQPVERCDPHRGPHPRRPAGRPRRRHGVLRPGRELPRRPRRDPRHADPARRRRGTRRPPRTWRRPTGS